MTPSSSRKDSKNRAPLRLLLGRGVANHPGLCDAIRDAALGPTVIGMHHHTPWMRAGAGPDEWVRELKTQRPEDYVSACAEACASWGADLYWPGRHLDLFAARVGEFSQHGTQLLLAASAHSMSQLEDKAVFSEAARQLGLPVPETISFSSLEEFDQAYAQLSSGGERVCFKPTRGVFARGFRVIRSDLDLFDELTKDPSYRIDLDDARRRFASRSRFEAFIAQTWLSGEEWSVDCFRSRDGAQFLALPRRKVMGKLQIVDEQPEILEMSQQLAEHFQLTGLFNCQFKLHRGVHYVLEINPRPAGGLWLSRSCGVNFPQLALRDLLGYPVQLPEPALGQAYCWGRSWEPFPGETQRGPSPESLDPERLEAALPTGQLQVSALQPGRWSVRSLLDLAARRNAARGYLLVSRVLGKHLPVAPSRMIALHDALVEELSDSLPGPVAFVGMAETATGLGWGVYEAWRRKTGREDSVYLHTTRYPIEGHAQLSFEERHSHGPSQVICVPSDPACAALWRQARSLVVVDDEVTTGLTAAGLADAVVASGVPVLQRALVSIVATRSEALHAGALAGWEIPYLADVSVHFEPNPSQSTPRHAQGLTPLSRGQGSQDWGRRGALRAPPLPGALLEEILALTAGQQRVYIVGAGECMHPALVLGCALERHGKVVMVQSSTRSPVLPGGAIPHSLDAEDGLGSGVPFFVHNPPPARSCVLALHEPGADASARALVESLGAHPVEVWDA